MARPSVYLSFSSSFLLSFFFSLSLKKKKLNNNIEKEIHRIGEENRTRAEKSAGGDGTYGFCTCIHANMKTMNTIVCDVCIELDFYHGLWYYVGIL